MQQMSIVYNHLIFQRKIDMPVDCPSCGKGFKDSRFALSIIFEFQILLKIKNNWNRTGSKAVDKLQQGVDNKG